jgi:hypothetical protein
MDARILKVAMLAAALSSLGASQRTPNFVVTAPTAEQARQIASEAERFRRELSIEWLGQEMPTWAEPCPIVAQVADNLGAGGATSFLFEHGEVFGWRMTIQGSQERILDSVLPHEVTHTIFASHFRRPLPRWADEGACTTVEHSSEKAKQQVMLVDFLRTGRGIAFNRMYAMKEYPHDVMPLYSQGYSVARYLIAQGGQRKFLKYLADGMRDENWARATKEHYGFASLAVLQDTWLSWVRNGSPAIGTPQPGPAASAPPVLAAGNRRNRPEPNLIYRGQSEDPATEGRPARSGPPAGATTTTAASRRKSNGWHAAGAEEPVAEGVEIAATEPAESATRVAAESNAAHQVTRPQPVEKPRQIILEWNKQSRASEPPTAAPVAEEARSVYGQPFGR